MTSVGVGVGGTGVAVGVGVGGVFSKEKTISSETRLFAFLLYLIFPRNGIRPISTAKNETIYGGKKYFPQSSTEKTKLNLDSSERILFFSSSESVLEETTFKESE